jgi:hypothetical protein
MYHVTLNTVFSIASRCTNFYKIPIFDLGVMPQKQNSFVLWVAWVAKKLLLKNKFGLDFFS